MQTHEIRQRFLQHATSVQKCVRTPDIDEVGKTTRHNTFFQAESAEQVGGTALKVSFVVATTAAARRRGLAAGALVPVFGPAVGGRGGGKPDLAQGAGCTPSGIPAAVTAPRTELAGYNGA